MHPAIAPRESSRRPSGGGPSSSRSASRCSATTTSTIRSGQLPIRCRRYLGFTDTQIGTLNAIYSFPNIIMVLVGGVLVDRFGTRLSTLAFALVCLAGAIVTALSPLFPVMAAGRLIFGLGAESMIVAVTVAIGQWLSAVSWGSPSASTSASRVRAPKQRRSLHDVVQAASTSVDGSRRSCWRPACLAVAVVGCIVYYGMDRYLARRYDVPRPARHRIDSCGAICGASIDRSGTSSVSASRSIR